MPNDFEYQEFTNLDQHAYLEVLATRKESDHFKVQTELELAEATKSDTEVFSTTLEKLTTEIETIREKIVSLPILTQDEQDKLSTLKQRIRIQPDRPGPPRQT